MKIAILGAGAMGSIYGARLSTCNEVRLISRAEPSINTITLTKNGIDETFTPVITTDSSTFGVAELVIIFVKALSTEVALENNKSLIGPNTYVMTLQNGSGHEEVLSKFVENNKIIIGTTEDSGTVIKPGVVRHGGAGITNIGMLDGIKDDILIRIQDCFNQVGFDVKIYDNIQQLIWNKLIINSSLSILTGLLQVKMGHIATDPYAWTIVEQLCKETIKVGTAMGLEFDEQAVYEKIRATALGTPEGIPSICVDLSKCVKTEVNTISGSVINAAKRYNIAVPTHELIVNLVRSMENRGNYKL
ncbi:MAG: 2-dehydropantoate 2-reductase [Epulopiscium sp. Nele67-Bin001]|nr:MAG: 2-dehydropantoate 2-reductase [Epulopiscium sp. Nele67-Bin001]